MKATTANGNDTGRTALLDVFGASVYLGVDVTTVYDYVRQGLLACVKLPKRSDDRKRTDPIDTPRRKYQFRQEDLDRFIQAHVIGEREAGAGSHRFATTTSGKTARKVIEPHWWKRAND
jgi:Helix-turn-helix domain